MPSDTSLTLFEREVSKGDHEARLRSIIAACLAEARQAYDIVLIDSAPGLSVLTECFLREADFYLSPTKPDYVSTRGLKFLHGFKQRSPEMGFAENLGVIINIKDLHSPDDEHFDRWLRQDPNSVASTSRYRRWPHYGPQGVLLLNSVPIWPNTRAAPETTSAISLVNC